MEQFLIYLWGISENIAESLTNLGGMFAAVGTLLCLLYAIAEEAEKPPIRNILICIIIGITLCMLKTFIPSKQDLALIFLYPHIKSGAEVVVKSETSKKMLDLVNTYLDTQLNELKAEKARKQKD